MTSSRLTSPTPGAWRRACTGALVGGFIGGVALLVGALAATAALLTGSSVSADTGRDVGLAALYLAAFAAAGAVVGALWPLRRTLMGAYALGFLAAGIVSAACGVIVMRVEHDRDPVAFLVTTGVMTLVFGTVAGAQIRKQERE